MKEIVVISGKGGTGKTTFATSLFARLPDTVFADCDVDAPDAHILLNPVEVTRKDFVGTRKARIDAEICLGGEACNGTRPCISGCRFEAIEAPPLVRDSRCEGCGVCAQVCPAGAIVLEEAVVGSLAEGLTEFGPMVHARLRPGEETSGKLVAEVRRRGHELAQEQNASFLLIDGSPGIGCPVISSLTGADLVVLVTEPSLSALRDLERLSVLLRQFRIPAITVINKWDISPETSNEIEAFCMEQDIPVIMKLPYEPAMVEAIVKREIPSLRLADFYDANGFQALLARLS